MIITVFLPELNNTHCQRLLPIQLRKWQLAAMAYQTRDAVKCPIFGAPKPLPENQLPTHLDVMKAFLYERPILKFERKNAKLPLREVAAEVA